MSVAVSPERMAPVGPGVELCYQTFGSPSDDPLLLVMGLGGPMTWWDARLCEQLAETGFFVIRYDNRDVGRSTRLTGRVTLAQLARAYLGMPVRAPYSLTDLATDAFGLLDHLGLESAHVWGVSMGGMIAQTMAVASPERVRSLVSMMSTTGARTVGFQHPSLLPAFLARGVGRDAYVAASVKLARMIGSPGFPVVEEEVRRRAGETWDRGVDPRASARQILAILTQPNRTRDLRRVRVPTLVVHGMRDKMVHVSGGRATSQAIPGAELMLLDGLGHDIPEELWPTLVTAVRRTADRA